MTWRDLAARFPEFVQWIVARFGPLPDGPIREADYERFKAAYESYLRGNGGTQSVKEGD